MLRYADSRLLRTVMLVVCGLMVNSLAFAQPSEEEAEALRKGRSFLETKMYTAEEDKQLLALYNGLRVADVSDGMDQAGLANRGLVSAEIGPLWRDTQHFTHRVVGIAITARYVPTNQPRRQPTDAAEFDRWVSQWYSSRSPEPFVPLLRAGSVLVI
jgi:4-hydroxy-4-methyl-2-oxoglutarate aldolase